MRVPDFFVVGAPKTGTTSLHTWLQQHPNVFLPFEKEPTFFATDMPGYRLTTELDAYLRLFAGATDAHLRVGEASVWYLYSRTAIPELLKVSPDARLIVMLRDPVELVHSLHAHFLQNFNEDVEDFATAWRLSDERRAGRRIPPLAKVPSALVYADVGRLGEQLARLYAHVPRERVHVVFFEDLSRDGARAWADVQRFLGLPDHPLAELPRANASRRNRFPRLARLAYRPPALLRAALDAFRRATGLRGTGLGRLFHRVNQAPAQRKLTDEALRAEVRASFAEDVARLEGLVGRDLSAWRAVTGPSHASTSDAYIVK
ncbi:MAG: sulfotransferase family protein [Myxococcota bacterium]